MKEGSEMSGPNRKLRRAIEAQQRKAAKKEQPVTMEELMRQRAMLQNMYDQRTHQAAQLEAAMNYYKALAAALLVQIDQEEYVLTPNTMEVMMSGVVQDVKRTVAEDGTVSLSLVFVEDDEGYDYDDDEDNVPEGGDLGEEE